MKQSPMTDVTVCIPYRETPDRQPAYEQVHDWYTNRGYTIITADTTHQHFNVAAARNEAVRAARQGILIVADADTIPDETALKLAVQTVDRSVVYPFNRYQYLTPESVYGPLESAVVEREFTNSVGGMFVTDWDTYWLLGGQDERFRRWGAEDNAWFMAADTLASVERIPGVVRAFGHDADRDLSVSNPGLCRRELYRFAHGRPELMRELIPEPKV